ncbi:recombinase family protein [Mesorhizobium humile]|uniref:Recombinase family protein n=1 Tax=Mesorhizobium humile TaxID=3072313 RepID=A0ABU4YB90_9HYPH|nr:MULTISPECIES: recombinase family protein [unclassified Mesorhizobium]MDX8458180.1 recombinase family protein [Mesorhizobium sp. VK2D]MDX8483593.1 recombinase family protein [Mesorhizobium sp. VK2B]
MNKHTPATAPANRSKAYSYVRFSTPEQQKGDSFRRQTEAARRYADVHNLDLQEATYQDLGVSAYRGANVAETGRLREFLEAVEHEDIPRGSYLLVESLDRISRQKPRKAVRLLEQICEAGIAVVTLNDGRVYTEDSLDSDSWSLMGAMMIAIRANEESETKARRLREAWANKRRKVSDKPLSSLCPGWLRLREDRKGFDAIPERAKIVQRVFDMTLAGMGQHAIAETLNKEGIPVFGRGSHWHRTYVNKMLADASTIGAFTPHRLEIVGGKKRRIPTETVEGYFPAVVDREVFEKVNAMSSARSVKQNNGAGMANILAGLAKCPKCGATMTRVNKGGEKGGKPYLVCTKAKARGGCDYRHKVRIDGVEEAIIRNAGWLNASLPATDEALQMQYEGATNAEMAASDEIENVVEAIARGGRSAALLDRLHQNEAAREDIRRTIADLERRIADTLTNRVQVTAAQFVDAAEVEKRDVALINATLRQLFSKVEVDWPSGRLWFHWKHAPGETTGIMYAWPKEDA